MSNEAVKRPPTEAALGKIIDKVFSLRKKKSDLEAALKDVEGQIAELDADLMESMGKAGVEKTSTKTARSRSALLPSPRSRTGTNSWPTSTRTSTATYFSAASAIRLGVS